MWKIFAGFVAFDCRERSAGRMDIDTKSLLRITESMHVSVYSSTFIM